MASQQIESALESATDTQVVYVGDDVVNQVDEVFGRLFGDQTAIVVADENTYGVLGEQVQRAMQGAGRSLHEPYVFPSKPVLRADYREVEKLRDALGGDDVIAVAVGSGVLTDIVKRASHELERRYICVGTAASMDGYSAFGASIAVEGFKQTLTCPAPSAVFAELDVLTQAPADMTASGYADLLGKITAGADWIMADAFGIEAIDRTVWDLVQRPLRGAIGRPAELHTGDVAATRSLIEGLIMSGLAMQAHASSRPASGSEHLFSHLWEMEGVGVDRDPPLSHGFKVGIGSIAVASLYDRMFARDLGAIDVDALVSRRPTREQREQEVRATHTTPGLNEAAVAESMIKYLDADALRARLELIRERWSDVKPKVEEQLLSADELRDLLKAAGCPVHPSEIGVDMAAFRATFSRAQMIRRRWVSLDLCYETGILDECVEELFAPGGYWAS